jgi:hypothetical protein
VITRARDEKEGLPVLNMLLLLLLFGLRDAEEAVDGA